MAAPSAIEISFYRGTISIVGPAIDAIRQQELQNLPSEVQSQVSCNESAHITVLWSAEVQELEKKFKKKKI